MISSRMSCLGAVLTGLFLTSPAAADMAACSCDNLDSLQQQYQNALYMEKSYRDLAKAMKDWEATAFKRANLQSPPLDVHATSRAMVEKAVKEHMYAPFPTDGSHIGGEPLEMLPETCIIPEAEIKRVEDGASCSGEAEAEIVKTVEQQLVCEKMGAGEYWSRPGSKFAQEKADNYKDKAAYLKTLIGGALDQAEITVSGDWPYRMSMPGMEMDYHFEFKSTDMNRASSTGDKWDFSASGETRHALTGAHFDELNCVGSGAVVHKFNVKMQTDGLTFGLVYDGKLGGGEHVVMCEGIAVPMPPSEGSGWGQFNTPKMPLAVGTTYLPSDWTGALAPMAGAGMSMLTGITVTGEATTTLTVNCPKP